MEISVTTSQKVFLDQYTSMMPSVTIKDEVQEGETIKDAYNRLNSISEALFYQKVLQDSEGLVSPGNYSFEDECVKKVTKLLEDNPKISEELDRKY